VALERRRNNRKLITMRGLLFIPFIAIALSGCSQTPQENLAHASVNCDVDEAKAALAAKADVNLRNDGNTLLSNAARFGCAGVARVLISAGADPNARSSRLPSNQAVGETPLYLAAMDNHLDVVKILIAAKADVNAKKQGGITALMIAARYGQLESVEALVAAGADVNSRDENGRTARDEAEYNPDLPSHFGTKEAHDAVVGYLSEHGAARPAS